MQRIFMLTLLLLANSAQAVLLLPFDSFGPGVEAATEISAFDPASQRLFVTNSASNSLDIYNLADPEQGVNLISSVDLSSFGGGPNSVAVSNGLVAVAIEAAVAQDPGLVAFFDTTGTPITSVTAGALPDMLTFTPDGSKLLVANEGEPNDAYTVDPEGSVAVIDIVAGAPVGAARIIDFTDFNSGGPRAGELPAGVRIFGPGASVAEDLEPEYITVTEDSGIAYVILQENNALAIVDVLSEEILAIVALGSKDHSLPGNGIDASDDDGAINIANWPVSGFYMPDAIVTANINGQQYVFTANEGDARDYDGFSEEDRVDDLTLDPTIFPDAATLQQDENLGRLNITTVNGDVGDDGDYEQIFSYGARSFSIWDGASGALVYDSGDQFEQITAQLGLPFFNDNDGRSDNKGPEPEGIDVALIGEQWLAFIGMERIGGVFVYDVSNPVAPEFITYLQSPAGDVSPEGLLVIPASDSPTGQALLVVTNEVSGTVSLIGIRPTSNEVPTMSQAGLLTLAMLMLLAACWRMRRHRRA
jgi:DNA-binding beta-propeller fold protein YncE